MKKLEKLAVERKRSLDWIIPPLVNDLGVVGAAKSLGFAPSTISKWLKDNDYISRPWWVKKMTPGDKASIDRAVARREHQEEAS